MESLQASASFEGVAKERGEERKGKPPFSPLLAISLPACAFSRSLLCSSLKMKSLLAGYKVAGLPHK